MTNPFADDAAREEAAGFADRVVLGVCVYIAGAVTPDFLTWIGEVAVCLP